MTKWPVSSSGHFTIEEQPQVSLAPAGKRIKILFSSQYNPRKMTLETVQILKYHKGKSTKGEECPTLLNTLEK